MVLFLAATQRNADGKYVSVSDEELAEICADNQIIEAA